MGSNGFASRHAFVLTLAIVVATYVALASRSLALPGVYMDAVNPDYLVVKLLNRDHAVPLIAWVLPGNYLAGGRVPVLVSLYHGLQQFWLGLPLYALLGTGVLAVRATHMAFAVAVLASLAFLLRTAGVRPAIILLAGIALAADPAFTFAFRTQSYITLAPALWLFLSLALGYRASGSPDPGRWRWFASGACYGLAVLGYFVYLFFLPVCLGWLWARARRSPQLAPAFVAWGAGAALGCAYYALGYLLLAAATGGLGGLIEYAADYQWRLGALGSTLTPAERIGAAWRFVFAVFGNGWHHSLMFGALEPVPFVTAKLALLLGVPALAAAAFALLRRPAPLLPLLVLMPVSFFVCALFFGDRLGGHHFMALLPIAYGAAAAALSGYDRAARQRGRTGTPAAVAAVFFLALATLNLAGREREFSLLEATGGTGLYSDAINRLAADLTAMSPRPLVFFPDWGLALPVVMLSHGSVPSVENLDRALAIDWLCRGRDVGIALVGGDRAERARIIARDLDWPLATLAHYRQRDGVAMSALALFRGDPASPGCVRAPASPTGADRASAGAR